MPAHCAVVNCSDKYVHSGSISFHRFPFKRKDLLQKWVDFTQRGGQWMPSKWSAVCGRHFVDNDFNCSNNRKTLKKNAVPTVRVQEETLNVIVEQVTLPPTNTLTNNCAVAVTGTKSTCRFCGNVALNCVSFEKSFELFAMIQKCFPTLQILQDDTLPLPKDICGDCCRQLKHFSQFCDVVIMAQGELQRKYRRQLKIKQEPVVRVKQEACESLDNLFPDDLDIGLDDGCDHDPEANDETEQKFQFCNFPMLNAQDIINNCDIMEIINLDDPFINIADDTDVAQSHSGSLPTPHELLQSELLTEEHNYAKEDWQLPPLEHYKTEKVEGVEQQEQSKPKPQMQSQPQPQPLAQVQQQTQPQPQQQQQQQQPPQSQSQSQSQSQQQQPQPQLQPQSESTVPTEPRSSKPIVTNVSQIPNQMICELMQPPPPPPPVATTSTKPNIVVLNDSVVQSSAFRLHNCNLCTNKFFTAESLQQHYTLAHPVPAPTPAPEPQVAPPAATPVAPAMISIPPPNINQISNNSLKVEASGGVPLSLPPTVNYWQSDWLPQQLPGKKKIDILDMQRSFLHYNDLIAEPPVNQPESQNFAYAKLAARYRRLQEKCRQLRSNRKSNVIRAKWRLRCGRCSCRFANVLQLLGHRQRKRHFVLPPRTFAAKCFGCLRLFRSRLGLRQHIRYICQLLPLRNARLQRYKCRHCKSISFTHWRFYRRHEVMCRQRRQSKPRPLKRRNQPAAKPTKRNTIHSCSVCQKTFSSLTGLKQHRITHSSERRYKCNKCERVFKRRNGLSQHVKGYHLQLKPHQCPVCQHRYALKCDMLRCRHSQRRGVAVGVGEVAAAKT